MYCKYVPSFISMISLVQSATLLSTTESSTLNASDASSSSTNEDLNHLTNEFLECLKIELLLNDYILLDNASLYAPAYANFSTKGLWEYGSYYIDKSNESLPVALICSPFSLPPRQETKYQSKDLLLSYIDSIGMCISLLSLALHFAAFLIVPEMKNLQEKNLASLTVSLFFAYLLVVVREFEFDKIPTCYLLGISFYYFFMVSFFWMNAISYDIFKSVRAATTKLRLMSKSAEFKRFILYSAYSWLTPAIPLGIVVAADKRTFLPEELRPKLDARSCWFGNRISMILFVASPLALLMLANIIFFIASAVIIFSNSMKSDGHTNRLKRNLTLYLKLAIIMGLGWIAGLVASTMENYAALYVVAISNAPQGLFIFIAFTKFRKTGAYLKERVNTIVSIVHSPSCLTSSNYSMTHSKNAVVHVIKS